MVTDGKKKKKFKPKKTKALGPEYKALHSTVPNQQ